MHFIQIENMNLSQIVIGTDGYGERIDNKTASQILEKYIELGGNIIDTARMYTGGKSESIVGEFINNNNLRDKVYISTKCSHPPIENMSQHRLTLKDIEYDIDKSLIALNTDYIDLLWLHRDDISVNVEPIIDALNIMVEKGKIKHFGASNWTYNRIKSANDYAIKSGVKGFCASQILYNMATCNKMWDNTLVVCEGEEKQKYENNPFPVFAFCSQAKGFFEKYHTDSLSQKASDRYLNEKSVETYKKIAKFSKNNNTTLSYATLNMLCSNSKFPVLPIIGPSNVNQLLSSFNK